MRTKLFFLLLVAGAVSLWRCDWIESIIDPGRESSLVEIKVDGLTAKPGEEIKITLYNRGTESIYLEGCNPIYYSVKNDTGWSAHPMRLCVWEGYEQVIPADSFFTDTFPVALKPGIIRFFAPVYRGCKPDLPISQAECVTMQKYYSPAVRILAP
jgi:hypothetical protein